MNVQEALKWADDTEFHAAKVLAEEVRRLQAAQTKLSPMYVEGNLIYVPATAGVHGA